MKSIAICVIGFPSILFEDVSFVVDRLVMEWQEQTNLALCPTQSPTIGSDQINSCDHSVVLSSVLAQAQYYLARQQAGFHLHIFSFESLENFDATMQGRLHPMLNSEFSTELFFVDTKATDIDDSPGWAINLKQRLVGICERQQVSIRLSPHSFTFYVSDAGLTPNFINANAAVHARLLTVEPNSRRADITRILVDHLDHAHFNRMLARSIDAGSRPVSLALEISRFMNEQWNECWDFYSFTGSVVTAFIDSMASLQVNTGVRQFCGVNEHGLACGALANWQLFGRAYVITITSGMIDEFKGTLSNLRRSKAPGIIICADSHSSAWFAFQGTINQDGDGRAVISARGLPHVYIESAAELSVRLPEVFEHVSCGTGPVFVFATPAVLESCAPLALNTLHTPGSVCPPKESDGPISNAEFDAVLNIVNDKDCHILWQCGLLSDAERELVYEISQRAGIALCDSLVHPGSVVSYQNGKKVENYLGTLGLYAFSRRVYQFLHTDDDLNSKDEQCIFFLKSKADQISTPFSEGKLMRSMFVVQINRELRDFAPFTDLKVHMPVAMFLEHLLAGLAVNPTVLEKRRRKISALRGVAPTVPVDRIETVPMTVNYFFYRLALLVENLIVHEGYRYTGVYDVGRSGLSAVRNIPRTDPGFSGWYGRALMGDALMALPYIALNSPHHLLVFVGDGAQAVVPDVEAQLASLLVDDRLIGAKNVSVFYMINGVHSIIQSYLDFRYARHGGKQVTVHARTLHEGVERRGPLTICRQVLQNFDHKFLYEAMTEPGRLNFFNVLLVHNSSGDGMSLASETTWSRTACMEESVQ